MKAKTVLIFILILLLACVPCLVSLAEGDSESSTAAPESSESAEIESSSSGEQESESSDSDGGDSDSSESDESESSTRGKSSSEPESSSSGSRFSGDPVQGKTPKFANLELGSGDPDDGKDFLLQAEKNDGYSEIVIRNSEAKGMKGSDNFVVSFSGCDFWLPIEIPAAHVEDDHINSKLVVSYGPVEESVMDKVASSIQSSHILQTFTLALTAYDAKGQDERLDTFDGKIKFIYDVNAACVNQYNRDGKLTLLVYNTKTRSLESVDYTIDVAKGKITVYSSHSGCFFLINSDSIDVSAAIKLNSNAPLLKVALFTGMLLSIGASAALIALVIIKNRKADKPRTKE